MLIYYICITVNHYDMQLLDLHQLLLVIYILVLCATIDLRVVTSLEIEPPDGKQIVFYEAPLQQVRNMNTVMKVNATTQLSVINVSDDTKQTITKDTGEKIYPKWFADGSMAYVTWGSTPGIMFTNGKAKINGNFEAPSWSDDGKNMLFHREVNSGWPPYYN